MARVKQHRTRPAAVPALAIVAPLALALLLSGCAALQPRPPAMKEAPRLRVGLAVDAKTVTVTGTGIFQITVKDSGRRPKVCAPGESWTFLSSRDMGDTLGVEVIDPDGLSRGILNGTLLVTSGESGSWLVHGGKSYRGSMEIFVGKSGLLTLVNVVDVESYLRGVVPNEIGGLSPDILEAVKAQAVAARTYCFYFRGRYKDQGFDVLPTVQDQVYTGVNGERPMSDRAIAETYGVIAVHDGKPIRANYFSTCGGVTASIEEVWPYDPVPYLRSVEDKRSFQQPYCSFSPTFRWTEVWTEAQFDSIFRKYYRQVYPNAVQPSEVERFVNVRVAERSKSGRVRILEVYTTDNVYRVVGDAIRLVLRRADAKESILRSTLFDVDAQRDGGYLRSVSLSGGGNGHGVGMCQNGAIGMARQRMDFGKILTHYYRGAKLVRAY
jgi:stage II sporulation protein D